MKTATELPRHHPASRVYFRTTALVGLYIISPGLTVAAPQADSHPITRSAKVSLADLDLSTPQGARAVREQLRETARHLCNQVADEPDLSRQPNFVACVDETLAKALQQVAPRRGVAGAAVASAQPGSHP